MSFNCDLCRYFKRNNFTVGVFPCMPWGQIRIVSVIEITSNEGVHKINFQRRVDTKMKSLIKNMALTMSIAGISLNATAAAVIGSQLEQQLQNMTATDSAMVVVSYDQLDALINISIAKLIKSWFSARRSVSISSYYWCDGITNAN